MIAHAASAAPDAIPKVLTPTFRNLDAIFVSFEFHYSIVLIKFLKCDKSKHMYNNND